MSHNYGTPHNHREGGGCLPVLLWTVGIGIGITVLFPALGALVLLGHLPGGGTLLLAIVAVPAFFLLKKLFVPRSRVIFRCEHCGVETSPQYRVCRSCGRVKQSTDD